MENLDNNLNHLNTYINRSGYPIMRRCFNCKFWTANTALPLEEQFPFWLKGDKKPVGYCTNQPLFFALTLEPTVYNITKEFYLCENHLFINEDFLKEVSTPVLMINALKNKAQIQKQR